MAYEHLSIDRALKLPGIKNKPVEITGIIQELTDIYIKNWVRSDQLVYNGSIDEGHQQIPITSNNKIPTVHKARELSLLKTAYTTKRPITLQGIIKEIKSKESSYAQRVLEVHAIALGNEHTIHYKPIR